MQVRTPIVAADGVVSARVVVPIGSILALRLRLRSVLALRLALLLCPILTLRLHLLLGAILSLHLRLLRLLRLLAAAIVGPGSRARTRDRAADPFTLLLRAIATCRPSPSPRRR